MKVFKKLLISSLITIIGVTSLVATTRARAFTDSAEATLPTDLLGTVQKTTTITDQRGEVLYYYYEDSNRLIVASDKIPQVMKDAIIAAEDERFYLHNGVDVVSIARALEANVLNKDIVSGGSTLTMQVVKILTGDDRRVIDRKVKEAYLATVLERRFSKEELLTAYLNLVPLGNNMAGVETASRFYFDKPATELTLAEAATLAALPTSPEYYATHADDLVKRRNYVLDRMVATGKITEADRNAAVALSTPIKAPVIPLKAPHFTMEVVRQLKATYGERLGTQGLSVTTSLDLPTQMQAEQAANTNRSVLNTVGARNVGIVAMQPKTGHVLAMVGSADYNNKDNSGEVNFTTANLSYGSTLKPLIYAMLMEQEHWSPGAIMWDVKTNFPIAGERTPYVPKNYDLKYFGPMTVRQALANSRNVTAIKALQMVGLQTTLDRLKEMGVTSLGTDVSQYGPSLAVGGGGIPLVEMTSLYTAFANDGKVNPAQYIIEAKNYEGKVVSRTEPANKPVLKSEVAFEIAEILQDNEARKRVFGPNSPLVIPGHTVAAKTGTAEDYRSALTIGFTPDVVTGVIVANNNNEPLRAGGSGAMAAAPFFNSFMRTYLDGKPNNWFTRPETVNQTEFATVVGKIKDWTAPWQSPTDRFNRRVAETDDPLWNQAVRSSGKVAEASSTEPKQKPDNSGRGNGNGNNRD